MNAFLIAGGLGVFALGLALGAALAVALVRDKISAMDAAASEAHAIIAAQSGGALRDLTDAHVKAAAMIDAIEAAKLSTARAELSINRLASEIAQSRAAFDEVARHRWVSAPSPRRRAAIAAPTQS